MLAFLLVSIPIAAFILLAAKAYHDERQFVPKDLREQIGVAKGQAQIVW